MGVQKTVISGAALKAALGKKSRFKIKLKKNALKNLQAEVVLAEKNIAELKKSIFVLERTIEKYKDIKKSMINIIKIIEKDLGEDADLDEK